MASCRGTCKVLRAPKCYIDNTCPDTRAQPSPDVPSLPHLSGPYVRRVPRHERPHLVCMFASSESKYIHQAKSRSDLKLRTRFLSRMSCRITNQRLFNLSPKRNFEGKCQASFNWRYSDDSEEEECDDDGVCTPAKLKGFEDGRELFNQREFYKCHDVLEDLWHTSPEPQRSVLHGILQCAVGLYHLQNQNHRGACIQFGEGLHKLRRQRLSEGTLLEFERGMAALLEFVYSTQIENAACDEDSCVPMTGDDESYRLLGNFGAGQPMYSIHEGSDGFNYVHFNTARQEKLLAQGFEQQRVRLPLLRVSEGDLLDLSNG